MPEEVLSGVMLGRVWCKERVCTVGSVFLVKLSAPFQLTGEGFFLYVRKLQPCA